MMSHILWRPSEQKKDVGTAPAYGLAGHWSADGEQLRCQGPRLKDKEPSKMATEGRGATRSWQHSAEFNASPARHGDTEALHTQLTSSYSSGLQHHSVATQQTADVNVAPPSLSRDTPPRMGSCPIRTRTLYLHPSLLFLP